MSAVGQPERATQNRVLALFRDESGYRALGDWTEREGNSNIEEGRSNAWLAKAGHTPEQINRALYRLRTEAGNPNRSLYDNNKAVYSLLHYGVPVKIEAGKATETVKLIDWAQPLANDFAIAEEVTLRGGLGGHERRAGSRRGIEPPDDGDVRRGQERRVDRQHRRRHSRPAAGCRPSGQTAP